ncbi:MAG: hypothetical protein U0172_09055 [Nitrospiraceae bacterium]
MLAAGAFATLLIVGFVVLDWWYFNRPESQAMRYGCPIGAMTWEASTTASAVAPPNDPSRAVTVPHGWVLWFPDVSRVLLKPDCRRFAARFRTAWPIKGSVDIHHEDERTRYVCTKRIPWSSAVLTLVWFLLVSGGTLAFLVSFLRQDGLATMGSLVLIVGVLAMGLLVLSFGAVTIALAYRIENGRLMQVWNEWLPVAPGSSQTA